MYKCVFGFGLCVCVFDMVCVRECVCSCYLGCLFYMFLVINRPSKQLAAVACVYMCWFDM